MNDIKISVIIAAYNIEKFIARCIDSIKVNQHKNIEIIVVNDGSTDSTLKIIEEKKIEDQRIKIINQKNKGLIEARKSGYKNASGEYIWFIDGDDWLEENSIDKIIEKLENSKIDLLFFNCLNSFDDRKEQLKINEIYGELEDREVLKGLLLGELSGSIWSKVIKKEFIDRNKISFPSDVTYGEDNAFSLSMACYKPKALVIDEYFYNYYQREDSVTKKISAKILELEKVNSFIKEQLDNKNLLEDFKEEFEYFLYRHNFEYRTKEIFLLDSEYSESLFGIWSNLNININSNKYFKQKKINFNKIFTYLAYDNYKRGMFISELCKKVRLKA